MTQQELDELEKKIKEEADSIGNFFVEIEKVIVGQRALIERLLLGLLANGHILIEGVPGLAKTIAVKTFAQLIQAKFARVQFTPDMLPADLTGAPIYDQSTGTFQIKKGPIFANIILADEINRAPAKVQSALLEVMQEKQVTIAEETLQLDQPFLVLATQNPIEQDGTYCLPESQLDRFMLNVKITYPSRKEEGEILRRMSYTEKEFSVNTIFTPERIIKIRQIIDQIFLDEKVEGYILDIIEATRDPAQFGIKDLKEYIEYGCSPRATIHMTVASKAYAFIQGRNYVTPQDVKSIANDILRHRIIESYHAHSQGVTSDELIKKIVDQIQVP